MYIQITLEADVGVYVKVTIATWVIPLTYSQNLGDE